MAEEGNAQGFGLAASGFKIKTMTARSQVHWKSAINPAGPCSIITISMPIMPCSGEVQEFGDGIPTASLKRLMKLAMPTVMVALPRPFAVPCARICVTMFYPK